MSEESEDEFHHVDFTVASNWEAFIKNLEEVIFEWKLPQTKRCPPFKREHLEKAVWDKKTKKEKIPFAEVNFSITRFTLKLIENDVASPSEDETSEEDRIQALEDIMCFDNDFPPQKIINSGAGDVTPHPLAVWYGLRDFVVVAPEHGIVIATESKVKILLSSVYIAVSNTNCSVPIFIQIHKPSDHFYLGVCDGKDVRVDFEMVYLKRAPQHCRYLPGLLDVFRQKVASPVPLEPTPLSVQFTYLLKDWTSNKWTQQPPDFDFFQGETLGVTELGKLPFGATSDPVSELHLFAMWPKVLDSAVMDGESYSDFEPSKAPLWSIQVKMAEQPACLLSDYFEEFLELCLTKKTTRELIGDLVDQDSAGVDMSSSLSALTEPRVPTLAQVLKRNKYRAKTTAREGALSNDHLMHILYFLFPDASSGTAKSYPDTWGCHSNENIKIPELSAMKTAPVDSLVWRLAVVMSHVLFTLGAVRAAVHLWHQFCEEMVFRWERAIPIPGVPQAFPDHRTCLLNQKLQMLNCCIERRLSREAMARKSSVELERPLSDSDEDDDEEFFDCTAEDVDGGAEGTKSGEETNVSGGTEGEGAKGDEAMSGEGEESRSGAEGDAGEIGGSTEDGSGGGGNSKGRDGNGKSGGGDGGGGDRGGGGGGGRRRQKHAHSLWNQPVGRRMKFGNLRLLKTGEQLYVPITQDPSPKTEDQVMEDVDVMVHLGTDSQAAELRARIMSASLLSDMESFKAANPGAVLEDFIRWYSPRDWIEEEGYDEYGQKKGSLSPRMQIRGNLWVDVWEAAKPVPARRQKRLFDDTREAEKVLHFLKMQNPAQMAQLLLPVFVHSCLVTLAEEEREELPDVTTSIRHLMKQAARLSQHGNTVQDIKRYEELGKDMTSVEEIFAQFKSLEHKFSPLGGEEPEGLKTFLSNLMHNSQVNVPGGPSGPIGVKIRAMFFEAQKAAQLLSEYELADSSEETWNSPFATNFPQPHSRHFIMRTQVPRPSSYSAVCPQKLSVILKKDSFRMAGCFTQDTTFQ